MQPTANVETSASAYGAPYVAGNFAPLMNEVTAFDLQVEGHVPDALSGRFLRVGPNPVDEPDTKWLHGYNWHTPHAGIVLKLSSADSVYPRTTC